MSDPDIDALLAEEALPADYRAAVEALWRPLARRIAASVNGHRPGFRVGLTGPQGSGKTTGAKVLRLLLARDGLNAVILSLDDLYLPHAARQLLALDIHPLLATRGVPGTHDVGLGRALIDDLAAAGDVRMPLFDKATDDRAPKDRWPLVKGLADVVLFEGWCVGARPESDAALARPVNALERDEDTDGRWRSYVNAQLAGPYRALFDPLDLFVFLAPPSFETVFAWRAEQEAKLRARLGPSAGMDEAALVRFIQHYERITRRMLAEAPDRADVLVRFAADRALEAVRGL